MKNTFTILIMALLLASCGSTRGEYYFECDQIDHYSIEIDEDVLFDRMVDSMILSKDELLQQGVMVGNIPRSLSDTLSLSGLESAGFEKNVIRGVSCMKSKRFLEKGM